ncbi:uncharacterized protein [Epargyreus clarus]|uniref:uncharacterized protein n=1 Tax=Epargyreus clarus TaxID=520877 RepID=UPI003C2D0DCF
MCKFNLKVPAFSPDDPDIWFALLETQFDNFGITEDSIKFNNVVSNIDIIHAKAVKDIIVNPPEHNRYLKIKSELIKRLTASHEKKVCQLLTHEELGDRKPSQFLRHLQDLAGPNVPEEFLKSIWSNRLPRSIQTVLACQTSESLEQLAELADRVQEIAAPPNVAATSASCNAPGPSSSTSSEIAELKRMVECLTIKLDEHTRQSRCTERSGPRRRRSSSRSASRSASRYRMYPICWYHETFGSRAHKCLKPCDYKESGNATSNPH